MQVKGSPIIPKDIKTILLIQLGDIGDVVLSLPCVRALKENFPGASLMVAVREKAAELIADCPWANGVLSIKQEKRSLLEEVRYQMTFFAHLRQFHFDLSVNLRSGDRSAILTFLAGARQRIGFYDPDGRLWQNRVSTHLNLLDYQVGQYVADYYSSLPAAYGIKTPYPLPRMEVPLQKLKEAEALLVRNQVPPNRPLVALQPFSLWQYKEWGAEKYLDLIRQLTSKYGLSVIIVGSPDERARATAIAAESGANVYNLAGDDLNRDACSRPEGLRLVHRRGQRGHAHRGRRRHSDGNYFRPLFGRFMGTQRAGTPGGSQPAPLCPLPPEGL